MMKYAYRECAAWTRVFPAHPARRADFLTWFSGWIGRKKIEYYFLRHFGLVGEKQVTGVIEQNELCAWDPFRDQLSVAGRHESIRFSVDYERRRGDLRQSAVAFPHQDRLHLRDVAFGRGEPGFTHSDILLDPLSRRGRIVDVGKDGVARLLWRHAARQQYLDHLALRAHRLRSTGCGAAQNQPTRSGWILRRELLGDHSAHRDAEKVGTGNARSIENRRCVRCHGPNRIRSGRNVAASHASIVERDGTKM